MARPATPAVLLLWPINGGDDDDNNSHSSVPRTQHTDRATNRHLRTVMGAIDARRWGALLAADQLRNARAAGYAFAGFSEGDAEFAPTFKARVSASHASAYFIIDTSYSSSVGEDGRGGETTRAYLLTY